MKDLEHVDQPDPFLAGHPERQLPAMAAPHDGVVVINARGEGKRMRDLAKAAGVDPAALAQLDEQMGRSR